MSEAMSLFDRRLLAQRRARAARAIRLGQVAAPDFLLERVADDIMDRLAVVKRAFPVAVSLGAYTGLVGARLRASGRHELVVDTDPVWEMLELSNGIRVCADEEALPFRDASLDLVVSALTLQFVNDLPGALVQLRRALKPDGLLIAALLGGETLTELRQSFLAAEEELEGGASPRVAPVGDLRALGGLLQRAGFNLPVVDSDRVTVAYAHPLALMQELRSMGATNILRDRRRTPLRRATLMRACEIYAERYSRADGRVLATFEIITLTAWVPHESQQKPLAPGSAKTRLADALATKETKLRD